ncbi:MAG: hypothetical protein FWE90_02310 [Defluviitaleaceae bacterium]|nr:hypothetical protein [Defluviitaleaceae bacterium]
MNNDGTVQIAMVSESTTTNGIFIMMGENMDKAQKIWLWRPGAIAKDAVGLSNKPLPATPPIEALEGTLLPWRKPQFAAAHGNGAKHLCSETVPTVIWLEADGVYSEPYLMNAPIIYTLGEADIRPGQMLTAYGRSLSPTCETFSPQMKYLTQYHGSGGIYHGEIIWIAEQSLGDYKQYVYHTRVPDDIPPGEYEFSMNLLNGGEHGFSNPMFVTVLEACSPSYAIPRGEAFSLCSPDDTRDAKPRVVDLCGVVKADGVTDNHAVLQNNIDKHTDVPTVLVLPPGVVGITQTLHIKKNIILHGSNTVLTVPLGQKLTNGFPVPRSALFASPEWFSGFVGDYWDYLKQKVLVWLDTEAGIMNCTLRANANVDTVMVIAAADGDRVENSFVLDCEIINTNGMGDYADKAVLGCGGINLLTGTRNFVMKRTTVKAAEPFFAHAARQPHRYMLVEGCDISAHPYNGSNVFPYRAFYDCVIKSNTFRDGYRLIFGQMGTGNNVIIDNVLRNSSGVHNGGETLSTEVGHSLFRGGVVSCEGNKLTVDFDLPSDDALTATGVVLYALVLSGKGAGQYKRITGNGKNHLLLENNWCVAPDETSRVAVRMMANEQLWVRNRIFDQRGPLQFLYGVGVNNIVTGNEIYNAYGITAMGLSPVGDGERSPVSFNLITGNRLVNTAGILIEGWHWRADGSESMYGKDFRAKEYSNLYGNIIYRNQIFSVAMPNSPNQYYNIWMRGGILDEEVKTGGIDLKNGGLNAVEDNYICNAPCGIVTNGGDTLVRGNMLEYVKLPYYGDMHLIN